MGASLLSKSSTMISRTSTAFSSLKRFRSLAATIGNCLYPTFSHNSTRSSFSTRTKTSWLNDTNPNSTNGPPKETILLNGCDFEHCEEEARMKIYSVSTKCYFAFGALVSEELSTKLKELPGVCWVLPYSYIDVRNKNYGGEPFIDGQAVPYDLKYHEEWVRSNQRAGDRNRQTLTENSRNYPPNQRQMPPWNNSRQMPPQNNPAPVPPPHRPGLMQNHAS
ncbi:hypothetical protein ACFE04_004906 [Oxalis oulophora]